MKPLLTFSSCTSLLCPFLLLLISISAGAQKLHVKVLTHTVDGRSVTRVLPGINIANGNANANCAAYPNASSCSATGSGSSISVPAYIQELTLAHIRMLLLLPDGRQVDVYCNDHPRPRAPLYTRYCKNPELDELEADFSGEKVKLTWGVGLDGKKKVSETYLLGRVYSAPNESPKP